MYLLQVLIQQRRIISHNATCPIINCSLEILFIVTDPINCHNASLSQMTDQRPNQQIHYFYSSEIEMRFPIISPLSNFPLIKLFCMQWNLQRCLLNVNKWQQSSNEQKKRLEKAFVVHKSKPIQVSLPQLLLHFPPNSNNSDIFSVVFIQQSSQFLQRKLCWGFKFNIHWYCRESFENFLESRYFLFVGTYFMTLASKVKFYFFFKRRQFFKFKISYESLNSTCSQQFMVMMSNQNSVLGLANIHFKHITMRQCFFEGFNCILSYMSGSTSMGYSQNSNAVYSFLQRLNLMFMLFMKNSGEKEQQQAKCYIAGKDQEKRDQDHQW